MKKILILTLFAITVGSVGTSYSMERIKVTGQRVIEDQFITEWTYDELIGGWGRDLVGRDFEFGGGGSFQTTQDSNEESCSAKVAEVVNQCQDNYRILNSVGGFYCAVVDPSKFFKLKSFAERGVTAACGATLVNLDGEAQQWCADQGVKMKERNCENP